MAIKKIIPKKSHICIICGKTIKQGEACLYFTQADIRRSIRIASALNRHSHLTCYINAPVLTKAQENRRFMRNLNDKTIKRGY